MGLFEPAQEHPVIAGAICFVFLAGALVGGIVGYRNLTTGKVRGEALQAMRTTSNQVRRLELLVEKARNQLRQSGPALNADDRIKANQTVVIVEENLLSYGTVLSNVCASIEQRNFELFRSAFDPAQQSNLLYGLRRDRQYLEQVIKFCKEREGVSRPPASRP
jgi:hypothetical protein